MRWKRFLGRFCHIKVKQIPDTRFTSGDEISTGCKHAVAFEHWYDKLWWRKDFQEIINTKWWQFRKVSRRKKIRTGSYITAALETLVLNETKFFIFIFNSYSIFIKINLEFFHDFSFVSTTIGCSFWVGRRSLRPIWSKLLLLLSNPHFSHYCGHSYSFRESLQSRSEHSYYLQHHKQRPSSKYHKTCSSYSEYFFQISRVPVYQICAFFSLWSHHQHVTRRSCSRAQGFSAYIWRWDADPSETHFFLHWRHNFKYHTKILYAGSGLSGIFETSVDSLLLLFRQTMEWKLMKFWKGRVHFVWMLQVSIGMSPCQTKLRLFIGTTDILKKYCLHFCGLICKRFGMVKYL